MAIYFGQDIDTKLALADAYFLPTNHVQGHDWDVAKYTNDERKGALNQAEREINLRIGLDLETSFSETDFPLSYDPNKRPDIACMEQALFLLDNTARTNTSTDGRKRIESAEYQEQEKSTGVLISPEAERYLGIKRRKIVMG